RGDGQLSVAREACMLALDRRAQGSDTRLCERSPPALVTLAAAHDDLASLQIHILHSQPEAFAHAEAAAVHQGDAELIRLIDPSHHGADLRLAEDDGWAAGPMSGRDAVDALQGTPDDSRVREGERRAR